MKRFISFASVATFAFISMFSRVPLISGELEKEVFYDVTKEINQKLYGNETEWDFKAFLVNLTGEKSPNVFYSTDKFLHEMESLSGVANLLEENGLDQSKLYLSFQILNNSQFSRGRYSDVFYDIPGRDSESVKSLQKHVSGILVEVGLDNDCYYLSTSENPLKVSFAKYAKLIGNEIIIENQKGLENIQNSVKVGLVFDKISYRCKWTRSQQFGADFIVSEVDFSPISNFPWTFNQFKKYLLDLKYYQGNYFSKKFTGRNETFVFKINLVQSNQHLISTDIDKVVKEVLEKSEQFYFEKVQQYAEIWTKEEKASDLILQNSCDWNGRDRRVFNEKDWLLPVLQVQIVDVNPCQLKTMLATVTNHFSSVIVNEFTWTAFSRQSDRMKDENCPNSANLSANPPSVYLFFTPGIAPIWDVSGNYFEKLLEENKSISGLTLNALVFSSLDLGSNEEQAKKMSESYLIGCAVNMQGYSLYGLYTEERIAESLNYTVFKPCQHIWDVMSVIVLQFSPPYQSFSLHSNDRWNSMLLWRTTAAQFLRKQYPNMEVILHLTNSINFPPRYKLKKGLNENGRIYCDEDTFKWIEFQREIQSWAAIHEIKIIFGNAFYNFEEEDDGRFDKTEFGLWKYPEEGGKLSDENVFDCHDTI